MVAEQRRCGTQQHRDVAHCAGQVAPCRTVADRLWLQQKCGLSRGEGVGQGQAVVVRQGSTSCSLFSGEAGTGVSEA